MKVQIADGRWDTPIGIVLIRTSRKTGKQYASVYVKTRQYRYRGHNNKWTTWDYVPGLFEKLCREAESLTWRGTWERSTPTPNYKEEVVS